MKKNKSLFNLLILGIFLLAAFFRLYGVNWDQSQHLHPDERFLTMVTNALEWPKDLAEYLDTSSSPLNPHNKGFSFFVYGTFPIFFTKWVAENLGLGDYNNLTLVGRQLSAIFDLGTVVLVFLIAKAISELRITNYELRKKKPTTGNVQPTTYFPLLAMFFYSISVLPIQLSHFYAVDTYLTFFLTLSFYLCVKLSTTSVSALTLESQKSKVPPKARLAKGGKSQKYILNIKNIILLTLIGISFGLALASKISAILFLPIILLSLFASSFQLEKNTKPLKKRLFKILFVFLLFTIYYLLFTYISFRLAQPYVFAKPNIYNVSLNQKVIDNWKQLKSFEDANASFPPAVQWIKTKPYLFPLKNMVLWGLGLPLGMIALLAISYRLWVVSYELIKKKFNLQLTTYNLQLNLITLWIVLLFLYQGAQFAKTMRYFHPMYPFLAILSGWFILEISSTKKSAFQRTLVRLPSLLIDRTLNLIKSVTYYKILVNSNNNIGVEMPRVEPGRHGLRVLSSKPAIPTPHIIITCVFLLVVALYPFSFLSIYSRLHSRVAASAWIYQNIPAGSVRSVEHWDDGLPLSLPETGYIHEKYPSVEFPLYGQDTLEKWQEMDKRLKQVEYIILSSNRLYGAIMTVPERYPITYRYYQMLFDGTLGFAKIAEFTSRPNIPLSFIKLCLTPPLSHYGSIAKETQECDLPGLTFVDDYADETFTVYDHPKVIIFKKERRVDYFNLLYNQQSTINN